MNLNFSIESDNILSFVKHWSGLYNDPLESIYEKHIKETLTEYNIKELYRWKNEGKGKIAAHKIKSIENNYLIPLPALDKLEDRYLNHKQEGGAIWNIFYLHMLSKNPHLKQKLPDEYPIFDKHAYRAMRFMKLKEPRELPKSDSQVNKLFIYTEYIKYKKFYKEIENKIQEYLNEDGDHAKRKIDMALFKFGQFLEKAQPYQR